MTDITFYQAKEFLENITDKDKVAIVHHDDGDGFCSGILYYDWCKSKNANIEQFTFSFGKWNKQIDLEPFNKIIITDIAPDGIDEINPPTDKQILCVDHHPKDHLIPEEILELRTTDDGYIPASRTAGELTRLKPWLSLIGTLTDGGDFYTENLEFINKHVEETGMTLDELKQNVTSVITNFLIYFNKDTSKAFQLLQEINSIDEIKKIKQYSEPVEDEVQKFVEEYETKKERLGDVNYYYFNPSFSVKTPVSGIISHKSHDDIYIFASPKNEGKNITFSARNTSQKMDMATLLQAGVQGLENGSAGGHKAAAGGMILAKDIDKFKDNIRKFVETKH